MGSIQEIKQNYIQGTATEEELQLLLKWIKKNPENRNELFSEKDILNAYEFVRNSKSYSVSDELKRLNTKIKPAPVQKKIILPNYLKIAAAFIMAFAFSWFIQSQFISKEEPVLQAEIKNVFVPRGQVNQIFLADGSRIWVNSESTINVPSVFNLEERKVSLLGEAYFEVAEDTERPFKVLVEGQTIEVLGTSFNVRAYENSSKIQTTLKEGSIKLTTKNGYTTLKPGEQTELDKKSGQLVLKNVNPENFESWKDGKYEFEEENLVEVFNIVERWYDIDLIYDIEDFGKLNYTGTIKRNKSVKHFLRVLGLTVPINYEINIDNVKIKKK